MYVLLRLDLSPLMAVHIGYVVTIASLTASNWVSTCAASSAVDSRPWIV